MRIDAGDGNLLEVVAPGQVAERVMAGDDRAPLTVGEAFPVSRVEITKLALE